MARLRRIFLEGLSVHVIQRGNNRMAIFHDDDDYAFYMTFLVRAIREHAVSLHGFVLMTTHVHLIVTPAHAISLPNTMKELGGRYTSHFNRKYNRTGTLWNGRYRGLVIQDERYWLTCLRYVEQNPVRAGMVAAPSDYIRSSYSAHAFGERPEWLTPHRLYLGLGSSPTERQAAYRAICGEQLTAADLAPLRVTPDRIVCPITGVGPGSDPT